MKRALTIFVMATLLFFVCTVSPAYAIAGVDDLVVVGTTVMTMALLGTIGIMSINSAGFSDALVAAAENAGQGAKEFGQALFASYARTQNITAGQAVQLAAQGTQYLSDGTIILDEQMSKLMDGYIKWAWDSDNGPKLIDYAEPVSQSTVNVTNADVNTSMLERPNFNYNIYYNTSISMVLRRAPTLVYDYYCTPSNGGVYCYWYPSSNYVRFGAVSEGPFTLTYKGEPSTIRTVESSAVTRNNVTYYVANTTGFDYLYTVESTNAPASNSAANWDVAYLVFGSGKTSEDVNYDTNLGVFEGVSEGMIGVFDPDTFVSVPDTNVTGGQVDVQAWLDALAEMALEGTATIPVSVDGAVNDVSLDSTSVKEIPVTSEQAGSMSGAGSVAGSTSVDGLEEFTLELVDFFPFCIPFDIYDMLSLFAAEREAPHFEWRFYVPDVCDEVIEIDLSPFDQAAAVLRSVELVAAAIGLAFVTKKLIQGGD